MNLREAVCTGLRASFRHNHSKARLPNSSKDPSSLQQVTSLETRGARQASVWRWRDQQIFLWLLFATPLAGCPCASLRLFGESILWTAKRPGPPHWLLFLLELRHAGMSWPLESRPPGQQVLIQYLGPLSSQHTSHSLFIQRAPRCQDPGPLLGLLLCPLTAHLPTSAT